MPYMPRVMPVLFRIMLNSRGLFLFSQLIFAWLLSVVFLVVSRASTSAVNMFDMFDQHIIMPPNINPLRYSANVMHVENARHMHFVYILIFLEKLRQV